MLLSVKLQKAKCKNCWTCNPQTYMGAEWTWLIDRAVTAQTNISEWEKEIRKQPYTYLAVATPTRINGQLFFYSKTQILRNQEGKDMCWMKLARDYWILLKSGNECLVAFQNAILASKAFFGRLFQRRSVEHFLSNAIQLTTFVIS